MVWARFPWAAPRILAAVWRGSGLGPLAGLRDLTHRCIAEPVAKLREVEAPWRDVPVERLDVTVLLRRVLQRNVEHDGVDADVAEREVLRGRRPLHQKVSFAVPEH